MDEDERLRQLIATVREHPKDSRERQKAMTQLLIFIQRLPEFRRYSSRDHFPNALNQTLEWFSRNIREFQSHTSSVRSDLVRWLKSYLYWRLHDLDPERRSFDLSLDEEVSDADGNRTTWLEQVSEERRLLGTRSNPYVLDGLEIYIEQLQRHSQRCFVLQLEHYIEQDPDNRLRNCHPRNYPECNCQVLSQRLLLKQPPDKLADIVREYGINDQTLRSHWRLKGIPLLQEIATELGYQSNLINSHE